MTELEYSEFLKSETDLEYEAGLYSLEHHGIKGMKWGVRRTPEQLGHKTKKKSLVSRVKTAAKKKAAKKKKAEAKKKAAEKKKEEESADKIKEKVMKSVDPKLIYKYRALLSDQELQDRINRINKEEALKKLIPDPKGKQKKAIKDGEDFLKSAASMAESISKVYNTYEKLTGSGKSNDKSTDKSEKKQNVPKQSSSQTFTDSSGWTRDATGRMVPKKKKK